MLNRLADLVRLRAYADLLVQPVGRAAAATMADFEIGAHVTALVELARNDGTVRASINGQAFDLHLPFGARAGDSLALRVTAREPRLRFTLEPGADHAPRAASLSETARFITALLAESEKLPLSGISAPAAAGPPLLEGEPADSRAIAIAMKHALADSGMFYEAHQAQWVADERPLAALMREPQAHFAPLAADDKSPSTAADLPLLKELPVHRDALTVVRQQLETLDTRQMVWQGTLWPGQTIEWQVGEEPRRAQASADEREWQSRLRLTLPRLGDIDAALSISPHGVRISVRAASAESAELLDAHRQALHDALAGAGVAPLGIGVVHAGD